MAYLFNTPDELQRYLAAQGSEQRAAFTAKLIPGLSRPLQGIPIPLLRDLGRKLAREDAARAIDHLLTGDTLDEVMLKGFVIGYAKLPWEEWERRVEAFVPLMDNWATCDTVCSSLTLVRKHREEGWDFLRPHWESGEEFRQRFGVIMLMDHFLTDGYAERVLAVLRGLRPAGYYAAMAVGWALQVAFVKWPDRVFPLLVDADIAPESRRLARKKILESLRTPAPWRERVKALRP